MNKTTETLIRDRITRLTNRRQNLRAERADLHQQLAAADAEMVAYDREIEELRASLPAEVTT